MRVITICLLLHAFSAQADDVWRQQVVAAKALTDEHARGEAMLSLVTEALFPHDVRMSGNSDAEYVDPKDNQPAPVVNFDPRLNEKKSGHLKSGAAAHSLRNNSGYYFSENGVAYVVLGPAALDARSPLFTRLAADHELYHAAHHVGDNRPLADRELETWTKMFVAYFDRIFQFRQQWAPMLSYYEEAGAGERKAAIDRLAGYYRSIQSTEVRAAFDEWMLRRKGTLIDDLRENVHHRGTEDTEMSLWISVPLW